MLPIGPFVTDSINTIRLHKRLIVWILLGGLTVGCLVAVAEDASAVERPTGTGPYNVGYFEDSYIPTYPALTMDNFTMELRYYYPAIANGMDASPDRSDAFYPAVIYSQDEGGSLSIDDIHWESPSSLNKRNGSLETLSSWGMVVVTYTYSSDVPYPDVEWMYSAIMDHLEVLNETDDNPLYRMVDKNAFGVTGFGFGAGFAWTLTSQSRWTCGDYRIKASFSMHHFLVKKQEPPIHGAFELYHNGWTKVDAPCAYMAQVGDSSAEFLDWNLYHHDQMFERSPHPNALIIVNGEESIGPARMDYQISFLLYWLDGREEYRTFLYGEEAIMDVASGDIDLRFNFNDGDIFPPLMAVIEASSKSVLMDEPVGLSLNITGHPVHQYPEFQVEWFVNSFSVLINSKDHIVTHAFVEPGDFKISGKCTIGLFYWWLPPLTINVTNMSPVAIPGPNRVVDHDTEVVFDGSASWDTSSHIGNLEYKWSFSDGEEKEYSTDPTCTKMLTSVEIYVATLKVRDPLGAESVSTCSISVDNVVPTGGIDKPTDGAKGIVNSKVVFVGWGRDTPSDNGSLWYFWDFDDGWTADGAEMSHTFKEAGRYSITLTVEDKHGATVVLTRNLTIEEKAGIGQKTGISLDNPKTASVTIGLIVILLLAAVGATEQGKYWSGLMLVPLFTKTEDVLDNKTRHALLGIIVTNPGIHYSALREEFGLANGAAAYHLDVLERESFIKSVRDGKLKRFYSAYATVPDDVGRSPDITREAIVALVRKRPGISQLQVMDELGIDRDSASYYLRELVKAGRLKSGKEWRYTVYWVK
jgi:hypothetical protein